MAGNTKHTLVTYINVTSLKKTKTKKTLPLFGYAASFTDAVVICCREPYLGVKECLRG